MAKLSFPVSPHWNTRGVGIIRESSANRPLPIEFAELSRSLSNFESNMSRPEYKYFNKCVYCVLGHFWSGRWSRLLRRFSTRSDCVYQRVVCLLAFFSRAPEFLSLRSGWVTCCSIFTAYLLLVSSDLVRLYFGNEEPSKSWLFPNKW